MNPGGEVPAAASAATAVQPGAVKLPDFWMSDTDMWFLQVEAAFRRARLTDSHSKYDYILMKLPESVLASVKDVVRAVTDATADPYAELKARLVSSYTQSKWQLANRLLDHPDIGDMRDQLFFLYGRFLYGHLLYGHFLYNHFLYGHFLYGHFSYGSLFIRFTFYTVHFLYGSLFIRSFFIRSFFILFNLMKKYRFTS
jgi:hypothetical protein